MNKKNHNMDIYKLYIQYHHLVYLVQLTIYAYF